MNLLNDIIWTLLHTTSIYIHQSKALLIPEFLKWPATLMAISFYVIQMKIWPEYYVHIALNFLSLHSSI